MSWGDTDAQCPTCRETFQDCVCSVFMGVARERIRELEDAERACKAANESQRTTIRELEAVRRALLADYGEWIIEAGAQKARAEKEEHDFDELTRSVLALNARHGECQARVAELVAHVNELHAERKDGWSHTVKDVMEREEC